MKHFARLSVAVMLLFVAHIASSQEVAKSPKPGFYVFSQNKVLGQHSARVNALMDSIFSPILNDLVKEGKLLGWGQLDHVWGDEWNFNLYYITENQRAFLDFWSEYIVRLNKRFPGWADKTLGLIGDHKDNMYSIRTMR